MKYRKPGPFKGEWEKRHAQPFTSIPNYRENKTMTLKAANEFHSGTAKFERKEGLWSCYAWSDCLAFLCGKDMASAKMDLIRRGFTFQWEEA